ncbi:Structural toxin protein RtxA [Legionella hackeliae]|uniref:DUF5801 repeats-in-toxin domain-containing protein n=1 Tax=Legionella hackeliae TaxID=449 RepID=UPI000E1B4D72|nr:DUF5801 repeats-in-toxin domain-containing protein [Legionella hackeliae]STX47892.1 Structural toxin protein RtxA [Legionella hackeliae]
MTVDETTLGNDASANFADNFTSSFGEDGAGQIDYSLSVHEGVTGLVDTATNEAVVLSINNDGVVEGRTATSNDLVFTVSVNGNGTVTLDQLRAVVHSPNTGADQPTSLNAADLIQLTATITDKDGDSASAHLDLGQALNFKDDGPSINATTAADTLTVDETTLGNDASANFADNFTSSFGEDGAGQIDYSLSVHEGVTGLVDTATNEAVVLSINNDGVVEGRTANSNDLVFTVTVDSAGTVTLDQLRAVVHSPNTGADQPTSLNAADLIQLTATITDKDGDSASAHLDLGQALNFKDDGPSINATAAADTLTVDETTLGNDASANFADNFTSSFGEDGAGQIDYSLSVHEGVTGLVDTATNEAVVLSINNDGVVEGRTANSNDLVFTVSVNGNGTVTLDQLRAVVHSPNTGADQPTSLNAADLIQLTATITDKDGDSASAHLDLGQALNFKDDGPSINATAAADTLTVDETTLGNDASANFADNFTSSFGEDGAGQIDYSLSVHEGVTGLVDTATNEAVVLSINNDGVVEGRTANSNDLVFTVSVNGNGTVTLDQLRAVVHSPNTGADQPTSLNAADLIQLTATITDKDGDSASAHLDLGQALNFKDDGPSINATTARIPSRLMKRH